MRKKTIIYCIIPGECRTAFVRSQCQDAADAPAKAAADESDAGSFTKLTHAAEAFASHAASQAAGLFSYHKVEEEKTQDSSVFFIVDTNWQSLCPVPCFPELFDTCTF